MAQMRRMSGMIAAVLVLLMAGGFMFISPSPILSACFIVAGVAGIVWQGKKLIASREDPYDLKRLWEQNDEPGEPEDDGQDAEDDTLLLPQLRSRRPARICPLPRLRKPITLRVISRGVLPSF